MFEGGRISTIACEGHDGGFKTLSVIGDPISTEDRVVHLLASLPQSYEMIVTALEASPNVPVETVLQGYYMRNEK